MALSETFSQRKHSKVEIEEGVHTGLLQSIIHLGIQKTDYQGEIKFRSQILLSFELSEVTGDEGGLPAVLSMRVNETDSDKGGLVKAIRALTGLTGDLENVSLASLIGKPVAITVTMNTKGNPKINGLSPLRASQKANTKPLVREPKMLLDVEHISEKEMKELPEWIQSIINQRSPTDGLSSGSTTSDVDY